MIKKSSYRVQRGGEPAITIDALNPRNALLLVGMNTGHRTWVDGEVVTVSRPTGKTAYRFRRTNGDWEEL